jgi:hypothetical protein
MMLSRCFKEMRRAMTKAPMPRENGWPKSMMKIGSEKAETREPSDT